MFVKASEADASRERSMEVYLLALVLKINSINGPRKH